MLSPLLCLTFKVLWAPSHKRVYKCSGNFHDSLLKLWQVHIRMLVMLLTKHIHSFLTRSGVQKGDIGF